MECGGFGILISIYSDSVPTASPLYLSFSLNVLLAQIRLDFDSLGSDGIGATTLFTDYLTWLRDNSYRLKEGIVLEPRASPNNPE